MRQIISLSTLTAISLLALGMATSVPAHAEPEYNRTEMKTNANPRPGVTRGGGLSQERQMGQQGEIRRAVPEGRGTPHGAEIRQNLQQMTPEERAAAARERRLQPQQNMGRGAPELQDNVAPQRRLQPQSLTEEQKEARRAEAEKRIANMTPEQKARMIHNLQNRKAYATGDDLEHINYMLRLLQAQ